MIQELPTESKRSGGVYISTTLRNNDLFKGLKFCVFQSCLNECLAGCRQDAIPLCLHVKELCRLLEVFLNRQVALVGKSSKFGQTNKKWCLQI